MHTGSPGARPLFVIAAHAISLLVGLAAFLFILGWQFAIGDSPFLKTPIGDIATEQASYFLVAQDRWRWPWLSLPNVNMPEGANALFMGGMPLVGLLARIWTEVAGGPVPHLVGGWYLLCYVLQAHSFFFLMRQFTRRSPLLLAAASIIAVLAYTFLTRLGHVSLAGQFIVIYAAGLMVMAQQPGKWRQATVWLNVVNVVGLLIFPYFSVSVSFLIAAALVNLVVRRQISLAEFFIAGLGSLAFIVFVAWSAGLFWATGATGTQGATSYATLGLNLGSLIMPPGSSLFPTRPLLANWWEGAFYLGIGVVGLLALCVLTAPRLIFAPVLRHWPMVLVLGLLVVYCLSYEIRFQEHLLWSYPLPDFMRPVVVLARAGGRLFWPLGYLLMGAAVALTVRRFGRWSFAPVGLAVVLSVMESTGSVAYVRGVANTVHKVPLEWAGLQRVLQNHGTLRLYPSFWCYPGWAESRVPFAHSQLAYLAAVENLASNSGITVRKIKDCDKEMRSVPGHVLVPGELDVFLTSHIGRAAFYRREDDLRRHCREIPLGDDTGLICSQAWSFPETASPIAGLTEPETSLATLNVGQTISFTSTGNWRRYAAAGWSYYSEGVYTWTVGSTTRLNFKMPDERSEQLRFEVFPLLGLPLPKRTVAVHVNGRLADTWTFDAGAWTTRTLSISDLPPLSPVEIEMVHSDARPANDVGLIGEERGLGIGIKSIELLGRP
jgi:hypothetical protein